MSQHACRIAIMGANGYTGVELVRLLSQHPLAALSLLLSRRYAGRKVSEVFPHLHHDSCRHLRYVSPEHADWSGIDICFFATPHTVAMGQVSALLDKGIKVIDLSADFRIKRPAVWQQWYGTPHSEPALLEQAVYGLPERNRVQIKNARLIACPGCYPTAIELGLMPLLKHQLISDETIIADAKSGSSGAGRAAKTDLLFSERAENFAAYAAAGHRHYPEIKEQLEIIKGGKIDLIFTPHLLPTVRGIHATIYAKLIDSDTDVQRVFTCAYRDEPFVQVLPAGQHPQTRSVRLTNQVQIAVARPPESDYVTVLVVEDNLLKGAAGQAIQCLNIMQGFGETTGLEQLPGV